MAMTAVKPLPRAMLIDMEHTILSAYGCPRDRAEQDCN
jgi:putative hydrolase of the HAD superfamily